MSWKNISITLTLLRLISKWRTIWRIITLRPVPIMPLVSQNISITLTLLRLISKWRTIWRIITLRPVPIMPLVSHQIHILGPSFRSWSATIYESKFLFSMWVFNSLGSKPPKINSNRCPATRLAANCWIKKKFLSRNKNLRTVRPTTSSGMG